eukprot:3405055-Alexandrium_andersonii.AAC.1
MASALSFRESAERGCRELQRGSCRQNRAQRERVSTPCRIFVPHPCGRCVLGPRETLGVGD